MIEQEKLPADLAQSIVTQFDQVGELSFSARPKVRLQRTLLP